MCMAEATSGACIINDLLSQINGDIGSEIYLSAAPILANNSTPVEYKLLRTGDESGRALFVLFEQVTTDRSLHKEAVSKLRSAIQDFWDGKKTTPRATVRIDY